MPKAWRNVFISHVHEDDVELGNLKQLLASKNYEIRDSSINSSNPNEAKSPDYIWNEYVKPGIDWAGVLIVVVSKDMRDSEWVKREIEYAASQNMKIVGIWSHGSADADLPDALDAYADSVVGWQADTIIDAIEGEPNWQKADGSPRAPRGIERYGC